MPWFLGFQGAGNLHTDNKPLLSLPARLHCSNITWFLYHNSVTMTIYFLSRAFLHFLNQSISWIKRKGKSHSYVKLEEKQKNTWCLSHLQISISHTHTHIHKQKNNSFISECSCVSFISSPLLHPLNLNCVLHNRDGNALELDLAKLVQRHIDVL